MKIDKKQLNKLAKCIDARFIVLFGSRADKTFEEKSDFDVAIFLSGKSIFENIKIYSSLLERLSRIFKIEENKIDLTDLNGANILLRYEITSNGVLLYGDKDDYAQYQAFAFREYIDAKSLFALEDVLIRRRQQALAQALR